MVDFDDLRRQAETLQLGGTGQAEARPFIDPQGRPLDPGVTAQREQPEPTGLEQLSAERFGVIGTATPPAPLSGQAELGRRPPVFREGDAPVVLESMSEERIWDLQQAMAEVGLLTGDFRKGLADGVTLSALTRLHGWANQLGHGEDLQVTLQTLASQPELTATDGDVIDSEETDPVNLLPRSDPAELAQRARESISDMLGREPDEDEVQQAANALAGFDIQAKEQAEELQRRQRAGDPTGQRPTAINPNARLTRFLRERYRPEIDRRERVREAIEGRQSLTANIGAIDRMIG